MYINLRIFTPLAVKFDLALNTPWKTLRGDLDLKLLKIRNFLDSLTSHQKRKIVAPFFWSKE